MVQRLGIFGGTFDPPHTGHLIVAADAFERLGLDRLLFIPTAIPPHKRAGAVATPDQRMRMLAAAIAGDPRFSVDDVEISRGGTSYTVDTLRELKRREPESELFLLLGVDQYRMFDTWREPATVSQLATLCVMERAGETVRLTPSFRARTLEVTRVDISSTDLRRRIADGVSIRYFVPDPVLDIIRIESIYG